MRTTINKNKQHFWSHERKLRKCRLLFNCVPPSLPESHVLYVLTSSSTWTTQYVYVPIPDTPESRSEYSYILLKIPGLTSRYLLKSSVCVSCSFWPSSSSSTSCFHPQAVAAPGSLFSPSSTCSPAKKAKPLLRLCCYFRDVAYFWLWATQVYICRRGRKYTQRRKT